jgi:hypothetical protein
LASDQRPNKQSKKFNNQSHAVNEMFRLKYLMARKT